MGICEEVLHHWTSRNMRRTRQGKEGGTRNEQSRGKGDIHSEGEKMNRAKGGIILAIRKGLGLDIEWVQTRTDEAIAVKWKKEREN